jgi:hypothetical protein
MEPFVTEKRSWARRLLAHQVVELVGLEMFFALRVDRQAVTGCAGALGGEFFNGLPQQGNLVLLPGALLDQAASGPGSRGSSSSVMP